MCFHKLPSSLRIAHWSISIYQWEEGEVCSPSQKAVGVPQDQKASEPLSFAIIFYLQWGYYWFLGNLLPCPYNRESWQLWSVCGRLWMQQKLKNKIKQEDFWTSMQVNHMLWVVPREYNQAVPSQTSVILLLAVVHISVSIASWPVNSTFLIWNKRGQPKIM